MARGVIVLYSNFLLLQAAGSGLRCRLGLHGANRDVSPLDFQPECRAVEGRSGVDTAGGVYNSCTTVVQLLYSKATTPRKFSARQSAGERSWASLDKTKQQNVSWIFISK